MYITTIIKKSSKEKILPVIPPSYSFHIFVLFARSICYAHDSSIFVNFTEAIFQSFLTFSS